MGCGQSKWRNNACDGCPVFDYLKKFVIDLESWEKLHLFIGTLALVSSAATNLAYPRLIGSIIDSTTTKSISIGSTDISSGLTPSSGFENLFGIYNFFGGSDSTFKKLLFTALPLYMIGSLSSYIRVYNFQKAKYLIEKRYRIQMYRTLMLQVK